MLKSLTTGHGRYTSAEVAIVELSAGGAEALPLVLVSEDSEDFQFVENAETTFLDLEDGIKCNWETDEWRDIRCVVDVTLDESAGLGATLPTEGDLVSIVVYNQDGDILAVADEGLVEAIDAQVQFTVDSVIPKVQGGSILKIAAKASAASEAADYDAAPGVVRFHPAY